MVNASVALLHEKHEAIVDGSNWEGLLSSKSKNDFFLTDYPYLIKFCLINQTMRIII